MWPFKKTEETPHYTDQQKRTMEEQGHFVVEGNFPISDDLGRLICKNCGTSFDQLTVAGAIDSMAGFFRDMAQCPESEVAARFRRNAVKVDATLFAMTMANCRKCQRVNIFSGHDLFLQEPGGAFGDWSKDQIEDASNQMRGRLTPDENRRIPRDRMTISLTCGRYR